MTIFTLTGGAPIDPVQVEAISYATPILVCSLIAFLMAAASIYAVIQGGHPGGDAVAFAVLGLIPASLILFAWTNSMQTTHYAQVSAELTERYGTPINLGFAEMEHIAKARSEGLDVLLPLRSKNPPMDALSYSEDTGEYTLNNDKASLLNGLALRFSDDMITLMWADGDTYKPVTTVEKKLLLDGSGDGDASEHATSTQEEVPLDDERSDSYKPVTTVEKEFFFNDDGRGDVAVDAKEEQSVG